MFPEPAIRMPAPPDMRSISVMMLFETVELPAPSNVSAAYEVPLMMFDLKRNQSERMIYTPCPTFSSLLYSTEQLSLY